MEDFFYRKQIEFLYIGKNIGEEYKVHMSQQFNDDTKFQVVLIDFTEDLSTVQLVARDAFAIIAEPIWNTDMMEQAEACARNLKNVHYLFGRHTLDEHIFKFLYQ